MTEIIDLFAGPGGWDVAAHSLGMAPLGIEWDANACATRKAAGLRTMQADVAALDPVTVLREHFAPRQNLDCYQSEASGRIERPVSEPAPTVAGRQMVQWRWGVDDVQLTGLIASPPCQSFSMAGKRGGEQDTEHVIACAHELAAGADTRAEHRAKCVDERSMLVVEPVRWVRDLRPRWVALEQVPPVIELWGLFAHLMESWGYRTWTGVLSAERYGVPQTRKRAILLASLDEQPHPPEATHQAYVPGEPQRHDVSMFGEILPWVSMAQALGWQEGPSPSPSVTGGGGGTGGVEVFASKGARERVRDAVALRAGTNAHDVERPAGTPAPTMRFSERMNDVSWVMRANAQENAATRAADEPAPTITGGHDTGDRVWTPTHLDQRPGNDGKERSMTDAVRVTIEEASILQSFPPDYPWQGSRSARFQQVGNAVPPLMARAILESIAGDHAQEKAA